MTVAGQPQISYSYDNADRLTQIAQGTSTVSFGYDNLNRRTSLSLSNGVNVSYSYDNDSRVTAINYNFGANALGNLTYSYDSLERRIGVDGSFARTGLPAAVISATYDAANELTNWNGTAISYDLNGNMLTDGTNTFGWNARNQVASLNGSNLKYDAYGRRIQNLLGTSFLYDGANAAQELCGSNVTANLLTGGIDELFGRTDASGSLTPLQDVLGSTIALVDSNGNLSTQYSYDPFGNTTASGVMSGNPWQYTGRENEGNGLYYHRARYYSSLLLRFVSQDPIRFDGGINFYLYGGDNPINQSDPLGLRPLTPEQCRELSEVLELEEEYGTFVAAHLSNLDLPGTRYVLHDFNSDNVEVEPLATAYGPLDIDWFSTLKASSLPTQAFVNYGLEKTVSILKRKSFGMPVTNYLPYSNAAERNAAVQASKPWVGYKELLPPEWMNRNCPCARVTR